jgi:hypothetical protein
MNPTSAMALSSVWGTEYVLKKDQPAPNDGVLVPEHNYRKYLKAYQTSFEIDKTMSYSDLYATQNCPQEVIEQGYQWDFVVGSFLVGLGIGAIWVALLK